VWVDADDGEEDGEPRGPYDGVEGRGQEVVGRNAVEPGEVQGVVDVHKHGNKLDKETVDNKAARSEGLHMMILGNAWYKSRERKTQASSHQ
jgi:hypothetical protein